MTKEENTTIKTRKKTRPLSEVGEEERYRILKLYSDNSCGVEQVASSFNLDYKAVEHFIQDFYNTIVNTRETRQLVRSTHFPMAQAGYTPPSYVNSSFLSLLSSPEDKELSESEYQYINLLVDTHDNNLAIQHSGLEAGLKKVRGNKDGNFKQQVYLRGKYLRQKPNIKEYLSWLREEKAKEITGKITKEHIQGELVESIEAAKIAGNPRLVLKGIDSLAKTIGAYTEKIQVEDLNPASAYDTMIRLAKETASLETVKNKETGVHEVLE